MANQRFQGAKGKRPPAFLRSENLLYRAQFCQVSQINACGMGLKKTNIARFNTIKLFIGVAHGLDLAATGRCKNGRIISITSKTKSTNNGVDPI